MGEMRSGAASAGSSNKWAILLTVLIFTFMATNDSIIVNVALPVLHKAMGAGLDHIQWLSSVYLLTMCAFLLVFGRLGDLYGKVRYFEIGVVIFSIGSLMCGMSIFMEVGAWEICDLVPRLRDLRISGRFCSPFSS